MMCHFTLTEGMIDGIYFAAFIYLFIITNPTRRGPFFSSNSSVQKWSGALENFIILVKVAPYGASLNSTRALIFAGRSLQYAVLESFL